MGPPVGGDVAGSLEWLGGVLGQRAEEMRPPRGLGKASPRQEVLPAPAPLEVEGRAATSPSVEQPPAGLTGSGGLHGYRGASILHTSGRSN